MSAIEVWRRELLADLGRARRDGVEALVAIHERQLKSLDDWGDGCPLNLKAAVTWVREGHASTNDIETALLRVGRNNGPTLLNEVEDLLTDDVLIAVLPGAWGMAEFPLRCLDAEHWVRMFARTGYIEEDPDTGRGVPAPRPPQPLTLYRGATKESAAGWSWTVDREIAEMFARNLIHGRAAGTVWTAVVEPPRLLARCNGREEAEYVVDPTELWVETAGAACSSNTGGEPGEDA